MKMPTKDECMDILKKEGVPEHIIRHSIMVARVAVYLARKLKDAGEDVNVGLVESAALLHDVSKYNCIKNKSDVHHGEEGSTVLAKMGLKEIAEIVEKHGLDSIFDGSLKTLEEKLVYYADKRVTHDKHVALDERFDYLKKRYPMARERIVKAMPLVKKLEKDIFERIGETPELKGLKGADAK